ncbi:NAD(P)H-binding protein [Longispora albida]|uniref:NAD(P)H-binding protein n=1 Tax=Longispora albida TaxID=203523 RepID=UPI00036E3340|nr:NAD(P)H-binding protein [Longispora albida]
MTTNANTANTANLILVTGATGKTGRRVLDRLTERGVAVRAGSRTASPAFDWADRGTWAAALDGVTAAYVSYFPDLAVPGADQDIAAFTTLAAEKGVKRLVLLSGRGEHEAEACEKLVQESGLEWTVVRASWFNQNFSESFLLEAVQSGEMALPVGAVTEPFADVDDIADVAVAALTEDRHNGEVYEVTGPRLLSFAQIAHELTQATGRTVTYIPVTIEDYVAVLKQAEVPADFIGLFEYLFTQVLDGRNSSLTDGVQRALGREPRDFTDYAKATAATGIWG